MEYPAVWPAGTWSLPFLSNFSIKFHKSSYLDVAKSTAFIGRRGDAGAGETGARRGAGVGSTAMRKPREEDSSRKSLGRVSTVVTGTSGDSDAGVRPSGELLH